jgi:hypothetical protein
MDKLEYDKIQNKLELILDNYNFFEKNQIFKNDFDIETNLIFKNFLNSLRGLIKENNKKQFYILQKCFLNFTETDFLELNTDIHSYANFDKNREWLQTGYPVLARWTDYYILGKDIRNLVFNIIQSKMNITNNDNKYPHISTKPYLVIDLVPSYKQKEILECGGYEKMYNLNKTNILLLNKKKFMNILDLTKNNLGFSIFTQSFPIWGKLTTNDKVFAKIVDFISMLARIDKDIIHKYKLIKKDKKIIKKINEPMLENFKEFLSTSKKKLDLKEDEYEIIKEINVGSHKYTFIETNDDKFDQIKRSNSSDIYSKLFEKVWLKNN